MQYSLMWHKDLKEIHAKGTTRISMVVLLLVFAGCSSIAMRKKQKEDGVANLEAKLKAAKQQAKKLDKKLEQSIANLRAAADAEHTRCKVTYRSHTSGAHRPNSQRHSEYSKHGTSAPQAALNIREQEITTARPSSLHTVPTQNNVATEDDNTQATEANERPPLSPQEILDRKLNDPQAVLTPNQGITLMAHCAQLGEQNATTVQPKEACLTMGNTGAGKSTTVNCLVGCRMSAEEGEWGEETISVAPDSTIPEVMPIGHGEPSQTFLPRIVLDPNNLGNAYCDCPGFFDNRGPEINIANAINTKQILQQAKGVKAILLTSYNGLCEDRGTSMQNLMKMCLQMFGNENNLERYQNAILLGITKAPIYTRNGQPISINAIRNRLTQSRNKTAQILAKRVFLFDPLDRGSENPDFWSLERCRTEIAQLDTIPQQEARELFQTALNNDDRAHLLDTMRQLRLKITQAIEQGDETALEQHWQLLQRLRVIQHPEVDQLMQGEVLPAMNVALKQLLKQLEDIEQWTDEHNFEQAEAQIVQLARLIQQLPGATLDVDLDALRQRLAHYRAQYEEMQNRIAERDGLQQELTQLKNTEQESSTNVLSK